MKVQKIGFGIAVFALPAAASSSGFSFPDVGRSLPGEAFSMPVSGRQAGGSTRGTEGRFRWNVDLTAKCLTCD